MKATLDAKGAVDAYSKAFRHLTTLPGFDPRAVLRAEAGSILKRWAGETKVTTPDEADHRARYRAGKRAFGSLKISKNPYHISVNTGLRGGMVGMVWFSTNPGDKKFRRFGPGSISDGGNFSSNWVHWKRDDWIKIQQGVALYGDKLREALPQAKNSIGFSRQSVIQIADALGIDLNKIKGRGISAAGITKARAAIASNGKHYTNGQGTEGGGLAFSYVRLLCTLPYAAKIGMDRSLVSIVANRAKFIETAYRKGAGESLAKAAKAFPNILKAA